MVGEHAVQFGLKQNCLFFLLFNLSGEKLKVQGDRAARGRGLRQSDGR